MKTDRWIEVLRGVFLICGAAIAANAAGAEKNDAAALWQYILVVVATGGFGGFVHGIVRQTPTHYTLVLPFRKVGEELGFVGDILVGMAAGTAIFFVMESFFGLQPTSLTSNVTVSLKLVGLGVIFGYMGTYILDTLALAISKRLVKAQEELEQDKLGLKKLQDRVNAASRSSELVALADAYQRWDMWEEAERLLDEATKCDPDNAEAYIKKSYYYAAEGDKQARTKDEQVQMYKSALELVEKAIGIDKSSARAYYNRACYKLRLGKPKHEVLNDLKKATELKDTLRSMARHDPDFAGVRGDADFKKLLDIAGDHASKSGAARAQTRKKHARRATAIA